MPQIMRRAEEDNDEVFDSGFMKLLGCDEELQFEGIEEKGFFSFSFSSSSLSSMAPQMLHFDGAHEESFLSLMNRVMGSTDPCSTSPSSASDGKNRSRSTTKKVNDGRAETDGSNKRTRGGSNKGKKEKIGDRISVLHKLVSPFGKSDTATVLHEAMGYIRFLHDQVQVLSSPYLQQPSYSYQSGEEGEEIMGGLKSRGLCLIPVLSAENMGGFEEQRTVFGHHCNSHNTYTSSFSNSGSKH